MARLKGWRRSGLWAVGLACVGCREAPKEAPPPAEGYEIASAAPRALGALAAGTDSAPPGVRGPGVAGPEDAESEDEGEDAGAPGPDAALEAPEDVPL
jgi:hypothetical protein